MLSIICHCVALCLVVQLYPTLCDPMDCSPPVSSVHGILQAKNTEVGSHAFLQGIFLAQELNLGLLRCRQILYRLSHQESPINQIHRGQLKLTLQIVSTDGDDNLQEVSTKHLILSSLVAF